MLLTVQIALRKASVVKFYGMPTNIDQQKRWLVEIRRENGPISKFDMKDLCRSCCYVSESFPSVSDSIRAGQILLGVSCSLGSEGRLDIEKLSLLTTTLVRLADLMLCQDSSDSRLIR